MKVLATLALTCIFALCLPTEASEPAVGSPKVFSPTFKVSNTPLVEASLSHNEEKINKQKHKRPPVKARYWDDNTKVWLARSCVGESGFFAASECMAIAWIYAKRAHMSGWPLLKMIRRYSAATKPHEVHRRPWIFELNLDGEKPKHWPKTISWKHHKKAWFKLLAQLDDWKRGRVPDPLPRADHYGSYRDANQSPRVRRWQRLAAPEEFKNLYFDSSSKHNKAVDKYTRFMLNGR